MSKDRVHWGVYIEQSKVAELRRISKATGRTIRWLIGWGIDKAIQEFGKDA